MFLGTHEPRLDEKGRLILPAKFREELSAGLAILFGGLISKTTPLGVAGFLVALVGLVLIIRSIGKVSVRAPRGPRTSFSSRLEDRWNKRNFDQ